MSGYALLARAWGAEVAGWDRVETPYLRHLEGVAVEISPEPPQPPDGWDVYVSTAFAGQVEGQSRADLLAELVALRRAIVVAGAHGKTTTSAMIAFCLDRLGLDPAFLIGGDDAAARRQRACRGGLARRRGGRVRPLGRCAAAARSRFCSTSTSTTTRVRLARRGGGVLRGVARASVPHVVRAEELDARGRWISPCRESTTAATPRPRSQRSSSRACRRPTRSA